MKYITFIIMFCLVAVGSEIASGQSGNPSTSVKFVLKNGAGNTITLASPAIGVTNYSLTFPSLPGVTNSLLISTDAAGTLGWLSPGIAGQVLSVNGLGVPVWLTPTSGTVTSVNMTMPGGFSVSGNPITTTGTLAVTTSLNGVIHGNGSGFTAGNVNLASEVTGLLGTVNGGTGINTSATPTGSLLYTSGVGTWNTLGAGLNNSVLTIIGGLPTWVASAPSGWSVTGNSGTSASTNFIGTTDGVDFVTKTNNIEHTRVTAGGRLGIGNIIPNTMLDLRGAEALRAASLVLISSGSNDNVIVGDTSNYRATGPSGDFIVTGFQGGYDGKILRLFNATASTMTIAHQNPNSTDTCRIFNPELKDLKIADSGAIDLMYDSDMHRWIVRNYVASTTVTFPSIQFRRTLYDSSTTSTTLRTQSDISFDVLPNQIVTFDGVLLFDVDTNSDVVLAWAAPMGIGSVMKMTQRAQGDNGKDLVSGSDIVTAANTNSIGIQVFSGTTTFVYITGMYINGPSAGTVTLKFGLKPSLLTPTLTLDQNSWVRMMVVQ
jgi:hypothetical protein